MTMMTYLGIDPSLTSTGLAFVEQPMDGGEITILKITTLKVKLPKHATNLERVGRLIALRDMLAEQLKNYPPTRATVEGYAYSPAGGSRSHALGEWGGVLRVLLDDVGVPISIVPPSSLKKYATGIGNSKKEAMVAAANEKFGLELKNSNNDEADALFLAQIACRSDPEAIRLWEAGWK